MQLKRFRGRWQINFSFAALWPNQEPILRKAKGLLLAGELVAIPTETVYGLAGNALNLASVTKIFEVKGRPQFDPLIVHVPDFAATDQYATKIPEEAKLLAKHFWPGPLTLLLPKKNIVPDLSHVRIGFRGTAMPKSSLDQ